MRDNVISIHALREEGDGVTRQTWYRIAISIHALREEGDLPFKACKASIAQFLSTPSARRATFPVLAQLASGNQISIHALREEGDVICSATLTTM